MPPRRMCAKKIPAIHTSEQAPARSGLELRLNLGGERYHWNRFHTIENDNQFLDLTGGDFACAEPEHHRHHRDAVHSSFIVSPVWPGGPSLMTAIILQSMRRESCAKRQ